MNDPANELRRQIDYNSSNFGELGKFIRLEYLYNILENFTIVSIAKNPINQHSRTAKILAILNDTDPKNMRATLEQIY